MPSFCRHNRLLQNCPICAREQQIELRPVVSPGGQRAPSAPKPRTAPTARPGAATSRAGTARRMTVRRLERGNRGWLSITAGARPAFRGRCRATGR